MTVFWFVLGVLGLSYFVSLLAGWHLPDLVEAEESARPREGLQ